MGTKPIPPLGGIPIQSDHPPGYRGRYDPPPFEDIPPGVEPPVPGFEPSPFEKPQFGPVMDRDRLPPPNYRDPYRAPFVEGPGPGFREMPMPSGPIEIPVHVGEPPSRYRDSFRPGHPFRDPGPMTFRDGQPFRDVGPPPQYRDGPPPTRDFRTGPPPAFRDGPYRNHNPYRDGSFRENPPHNFREVGAPFRPPSADPREPVPPNYHDPAYRDGFRDENPARDHMRPGYRPNPRARVGSRRNPNLEQERQRDQGRDRERFNENREPTDRPDRPRDEKRSGYEKLREGRDDRPRDYDRNRDYEKERERDYDRSSPDKKTRSSPKRSRDLREKKRSESRGRSRERDRDREGKREKKEDRPRDKSSADRSREHKEKERKEKPKDRKKKKREKEKDPEKKKKRDKKEKKDKDNIKKEEDDDFDKTDTKDEGKSFEETETANGVSVKIEKPDTEEFELKKESSAKAEVSVAPKDDLYGDESAEAIDKEIIQNYVKADDEDNIHDNKTTELEDDLGNKEEPFDGIELQATADELDLKVDNEGITQSKEVLAPVPVLSKWEVDEENLEKSKEPGEITSPDEEEDTGKVTSEVLKRAENAIFAKAINSLRPIEIKKISSDRVKLYSDETQPKSSIQITVPVTDTEQRSIEINDRKKRYSKTPPPRLSVKERLGGKVEDVRRSRDTRVVHSTVERVKSRSKTPKKDQPYRRVTVEKDRSRKPDTLHRPDAHKGERRIISEGVKVGDKYSASKDIKKKDHKVEIKSNPDETTENLGKGYDKNILSDKKNSSENRERKKSILDESHFEPDYDENVESDNEGKDEPSKKRERSKSPIDAMETKKVKLEETIKLDLTNVKKKPDTESESSSSDDSSSSSSSDARKRKKKKKKSNKKKRKRAASDSESDSDSSSDDHKKKKKKRKHKKKSSKKKKKSKHK